MTSKQIWKHEVTYHPEDIQDRSRRYNPDLRVYLPDKIRKINIGKNDCVRLKRMDQNPPPVYIIGEKLDKDPPCTPDYKVFTEGSSRLRVTLPATWINDFVEYDSEDILIVEVNGSDNQFRIYKNEDYNEYRMPELKKQGITPITGQRILVPLATTLGALSKLAEIEVGSADPDSSDDSNSLRDGFGKDIDDESPR